MKHKKLFSMILSLSMTAGIFTSMPVKAAAEKLDLSAMQQSGGSSWNNKNPYGNAFDGNTNTFFDGSKGSYCQVDLGGVYDITKISCYPRDGRLSNKPVAEYVKRMENSILYGSLDGIEWTELYKYSGISPSGLTDETAVRWYDAELASPCVYKYVKWSNDTIEANLAEIEIYGSPAENPEPVITPEPEVTTEPEVTDAPIESGLTILERTGWSAETNSQQATSGNNSVGMVLDGNVSTIWHSSWTNAGNYNPDTNPVYLTVNMGKKNSVTGICYTPRVKGSAAGSINGVITSYEVYISDDNQQWTKVGEGNMGYTKNDAEIPAKNIIFSPVECQYVKLVVKDNLDNGNAYVGSCAEIDLYEYKGSMDKHPINEWLEKLDKLIETLNGLTESEMKTTLLNKANALKTVGTIDGIESFLNTAPMLTDILIWIDQGMNDVYLTRIMDMLIESDLSAASVDKASTELKGFYALGSEVKDRLIADCGEEEFVMRDEELTQPLYTRVINAVARAKAKIDSNDGNDYKMLKELVSYMSGKYQYAGYENSFGMNAENCEIIVSNINFALENLEKIEKGILDTTLTTFKSGEIWLDTLGSKISAHGGQIIKQGDTYYWYGEDNKISYALTTGVSCYSSKDLMDWTYEGIAFKAFDDGTEEKQFTKEFMTDSLIGTQGRIERPKVIYNEKTNKYVMWMHLEKNGGYGLSAMGVAVSDSPAGPFVWQWYGRPVCDEYVISDNKHPFFRDMNLFVDDDGKAYLFVSSENNQVMYAIRLNEDYTWIDADDLESSGSAEADIEQGKVIIPDMRVDGTSGSYMGSSYTYGKKSFTRYQLASGGASKLVKKTDENGDVKDENGNQIYVSMREDGLLCIPEYEDGRWARIGQNTPAENKIEGKTETILNNTNVTQREAPAPIKIDGKYYLVTSSLSGWKANPSLTQVADNILGQWDSTGNPMTGNGPVNDGRWDLDATTQTSFNSQSTCVIQLPNGQYMYMGDRWKNGKYNQEVNVKSSTYVWLPITFEDNILKVRWNDAWGFDELNEMADNLKINGTEPYVYDNLYLADKIGDAEVTWSSANTGVIAADGKVARPANDTDVLLTATVKLGEQTTERKFFVKVKAAAEDEEKTAYLFVHFKDGSGENAEQIYYSISRDGATWEKVNAGKSILSSNMGTKGLRDPHIVRSPNGDKFYLIATDLYMNSGTSWADAQNNGSKSVMLWESNDLVNWSSQKSAEIAPEGAGCVWAPETIYDEETGAYMVYWASKTEGHQKIYYSETRDFVNFTAPQIYIEKNDEDVIDSTIIEENGVFYRFSKDETNKNVIMEKSDALKGTFTAVDGFTPIAGSEGPTCFKMNGENKWCLLVDFYGNGGYKPYISEDIASGVFTAESEYNTPYAFRHGTVIPITQKEYDAIKTAYSPDVIFGDAAPGTVNIPEEEQKEPVLWYDFENVQEGVIPDKSGNGNSGALIDSGEYSTNEKIGKGIYLDGSGYIRIPDNITKNIDNFTISTWINLKERGSGVHNKKLFDFGGKISFVPQGNNKFSYSMYTTFGSDTVTASGTQLAMDTSKPDMWTQLTIVKNNDELSMYVNGVLDTSGKLNADTASLGTLTNNIIGSKLQFNIDEFKLYNRALNNTEILINSTEGLPYSEAAEKIKNNLSLGDTSLVTENITLPQSECIRWSTSDSGVITDTGIITRPTEGTANAVLTATITVGDVIVTKTFDIVVDGLPIIPTPDPSAMPYTVSRIVITNNDGTEIGAPVSGEPFNVNVSVTENEAVSGGVSVLAAVYDENGCLIGLKMCDRTDESDQTLSFEKKNFKNADVKVFVWDSTENMKPLAVAASYNETKKDTQE